MTRRRAPWCLVLLLACGCVVEAALLSRIYEHNAYHRSKAAEYERLSELLVAWPVGARLDALLDRIGWRPDDPRIDVDGDATRVSVRPHLRVPMDETRDYPGFVFTFRDGRLERIEPIGPDGHAPVVDLSEGP
jgi:hypothetical protein